MPLGPFRLLLLVMVAGASAVSTAAARQAPPQVATPVLAGHLSTVAEGWALMAAGRFDDAIRIGEGLLLAGHEPHQAIALIVQTELARRRPVQALDRYEAWLGPQRADNLYLLADIGVGFARALAQGPDLTVQAEAKAILARLDGTAPTETSPQEGEGALVDAALARSGDTAAVARLRARLQTPMGPEAEYVIGALADAGDRDSIDGLVRLLGSPQPPVQLAAIKALGRLQASSARADLEALAGQRQPLVATTATVALAQLGDPQAQGRLQELLKSPNGEERLMVAQAIGPQQSGQWSAAVLPLLDDSSLMLRVQTALLLSRAGINVERAQTVLAQALGSDNPMLREQAGQAFTVPERADPALFRQFLRDRDGRVQLRGIQGLLASTGR